jgi:hypothetical protein
VRTESLPQGPTVVGQRLLESLGTELVEQRRRTLDVREHERHRSRWLQRHRRMICREQLQHKRSASRECSPCVRHPDNRHSRNTRSESRGHGGNPRLSPLSPKAKTGLSRRRSRARVPSLLSLDRTHGQTTGAPLPGFAPACKRPDDRSPRGAVWSLAGERLSRAAERSPRCGLGRVWQTPDCGKT